MAPERVYRLPRERSRALNVANNASMTATIRAKVHVHARGEAYGVPLQHASSEIRHGAIHYWVP
jgi:hypothetical protein